MELREKQNLRMEKLMIGFINIILFKKHRKNTEISFL